MKPWNHETSGFAFYKKGHKLSSKGHYQGKRYIKFTSRSTLLFKLIPGYQQRIVAMDGIFQIQRWSGFGPSWQLYLHSHLGQSLVITNYCNLVVISNFILLMFHHQHVNIISVTLWLSFVAEPAKGQGPAVGGMCSAHPATFTKNSKVFIAQVWRLGLTMRMRNMLFMRISREYADADVDENLISYRYLPKMAIFGPKMGQPGSLSIRSA